MFYAWKNIEPTLTYKNVFDLKKYCNGSTDFDRAVQCINNETFTHDDIIENYKTRGIKR